MDGYTMKFLRKYVLALIVASLALQPSHVSGMQQVQSAYTGLCNFLMGRQGLVVSSPFVQKLVDNLVNSESNTNPVDESVLQAKCTQPFSQIIEPIEQPINAESETMWHISHKDLLDCLKRHGLDIEKMWDRLDEDKLGNEPVTEHIAQEILNFFVLLKGTQTLKRFNEDVASGKESSYGWINFYSKTSGGSIIHDFLTKEFNLRIMNVSSEVIHKIEQDYGLNVIGTDQPLKIECINKIRNTDNIDLFHSVSLDNIIAKPSHILQALGLVIAYHFTHEALQQRLNDQCKDDTYLHMPLIVIRITQHQPSTPNNIINPKAIALNLSREKGLPSTKICTNLKSEIYTACDDRFSPLICQLFEETTPEASTLQKILCGAAIMCLIFNPLAAMVNTLVPFTPESPTIPSIAPQSVCFTSTEGTRICCSLNGDMSLTCCRQDAPTQCIAFNMLDNDNPFHNCCKADTRSNIHCSTSLCSDSKAIPGPCNNDGDLVGRTINETYTPLHQELVKSLDEISTTKGFIDNEIALVYNNKNIFLTLPSDFITQDNAIVKLASHIRYVERNLNIQSCNQVKKIYISDSTDSAAVYSSFVNNCKQAPDSDMVLILSSKYNRLPLVGSVLGHEVAHIHQSQSVLTHNTSLNIHLLKPGYEMSADILGSLASNYNNLAQVGVQWLSYSNYNNLAQFGLQSLSFIVDNNICKIRLPIINRKNAATITNLLKTDNEQAPHPDRRTRGTILLKLSPMIKAAVKHLEHNAEPLEQNEQCQNGQFNSPQINASNT